MPVRLHRALAWALLLAGATSLLLAAACGALLVHPAWTGAGAPPSDAYGLNVAAGWVAGTIGIGFGSPFWYVGRRLPGTPPVLRPCDR